MRSMIWSAVLVHLKGRALAFQILIQFSRAVVELVQGAEYAAVQAAPLQFGEPPLDLADPGGVRGREVQLDARVGQQPLVHRRCLMGGQVVADDVDGQAGLGLPVDLVQEVAEVDRPVLGGQLADHLAGGGVQRGEQVDGAVPDVVVAAPLRCPGDHRQHRRGPFQRLDLRLLIDREDRRVRRRRQVQADHVADLVDEQRVRGDLEVLGAPGLQPERPPDPVHDVGEIPTRRASSRFDQCVAPSGVSSRVRTTTSSTWASVIVRGTPGGAHRPARPAAWPGTGPATW